MGTCANSRVMRRYSAVWRRLIYHLVPYRTIGGIMATQLTIIAEFREFLDEYKVMGLAVAFIIGTALTALVAALVSDILMPVINPVLAATGSDWRSASLNVGSQISIKYGDFLGQLLNFVIIAFVVFLIAKYLMGEKKVTKK